MPEPKQREHLSLTDFQRSPVWVGVHNLDFAEPWHEDADEDTYRPWTGSLPVPAKPGIVLVAASFDLCDGSCYEGYVRATPEDWDVPPPPRRMRNGEFTQPRRPHSALLGGSPVALLRFQSPHICVDWQWFGFWGSSWSPRPERSKERRQRFAERRREFYSAIGKSPTDIFPMSFHADPRLATGILSGQLDGFYLWDVPGEVPQVEV